MKPCITRNFASNPIVIERIGNELSENIAIFQIEGSKTYAEYVPSTFVLASSIGYNCKIIAFKPSENFKTDLESCLYNNSLTKSDKFGSNIKDYQLIPLSQDIFYNDNYFIENQKFSVSKHVVLQEENNYFQVHGANNIFNSISYSLSQLKIKHENKENSLTISLFNKEHIHWNKIVIEITYDLRELHYIIKVDPQCLLSTEISIHYPTILSVLNRSLTEGEFLFDPTFAFKNKYPLDPIELPIREFIELLFNDYKKIFKLQISQVFSLIKGLIPSISYENYIDPFIEISFDLASINKEKELNIVETIKKRPNVFLNNRFNLQLSKKTPNKITYFFQRKSLTYELLDKTFPTQIYEQLEDIITELLKINLVFKQKFPLLSFRWFEERPIYSYEKPLSDILEHKELDQNSKELYMTEILRSLNTEIIIFKSASNTQQFYLSRNELSSLLTKTEKIQLSENCAVSRLRNYRKLLLPCLRTYHGICQENSQYFLIVSRVSRKTFIEEFMQSNYEFQSLYLKKVLKILKFCSFKKILLVFDYNSFCFTEQDELVFQIRDTEEIDPEFLPPELKKGRESESSTVYCLGKLITHLESLTNNSYLPGPILAKFTAAFIKNRVKIEDIEF